MDSTAKLEAYIRANPQAIGKVVDFEAGTHRLLHFDFTAANTELTPEVINNTAAFSNWISDKLQDAGAAYGVGGYMEHRTIYTRSELFDTEAEPRRLHLGVDIWAKASTPVYAPMEGVVHSFNNNNNHGDYGPTIILKHNLDGLVVHSLYGHLSTNSLEGLFAGQRISKDQQIGEFGNADENGHWPPHLHFQLIFDMEGKLGDYPGVGRFSEKEKLVLNNPDPALVLNFK